MGVDKQHNPLISHPGRPRLLFMFDDPSSFDTSFASFEIHLSEHSPSFLIFDSVTAYLYILYLRCASENRIPHFTPLSV